MAYKPVDTAIIMVVGPCIDDTNFKTLEEAITYDAVGMDISLIVEKTDGTTAITAITLTTGGVNDWTHKDGGYYEIEITAAQNTEEGVAFLRGICTGVLPFESPRYDIEIANVYDSLRKGIDNLIVDAEDSVWDAILTGAIHNIASSAGRRVREIGAFAIHAGTAQAGTINSITLAATADVNDGVYNRNLIVLVDNTGVSQTRTIIDYNGTTKIAIIDRDWRISPDATTAYQITPDNTPLVVDQGVAQAGTSTTITLRSYASADNNNYLCNIIVIIAGTGRGQARLVGSYDGGTKIVTICGDNWVTIPDATSVYAMMPYGATCASCIGTTALASIKAEVDAALDTVIPGSPTAGSINQRTKAIDELTEASGPGDLAAIKLKTDSLPSGPAKNVALPKFDFLMVLSSDRVSGATGKTVTGEISKDCAPFIALTNSITEVSDGMYAMLNGLTQAEMNVDVFTLKFSAAGCLDRVITVHTT